MKSLDEYMEKRYSSVGQSFIHWREINILQKFLNTAGGLFNSLLDCPCGYGRLTGTLSNRCDLLVSGDLDTKTLVAHNNYFKDRIHRNLDAPCDVTRLPYKNESFEGMVIFRLFHHLVDRNTRLAVFREAARVSRNFLLMSYYGNNSLHRFSRKLNRNGSIRNGRKSFMDSVSIVEEAASAGWMLVARRTVLPVFHAQTVALFVKMGDPH